MSKLCMFYVLLCFLCLGFNGIAKDAVTYKVEQPPEGFPEFYKKCVKVGEFPIVSSDKVNDHALYEAAFLIEKMTSNVPAIRAKLAKNKVRFSIMSVDEFTTDVPEHSDLKPKDWWDRRARGLGPTKHRPSVSCGEENLLCYKGDPYHTENILIHEFAHAMLLMGLLEIKPDFRKRLIAVYKDSMAKGLWKGKYAASNVDEYWAEGVQSWFNTNRVNDHDHNHVNTRKLLKEYDPGLAKMVEEVYGNDEWRYKKASERFGKEHLKAYKDQGTKFVWPERLKNTKTKRFLKDEKKK